MLCSLEVETTAAISPVERVLIDSTTKRWLSRRSAATS